MRILSVYDLPAKEALDAMRQLRKHYQGMRNKPVEDDTVFRRVYEMIGGRTSYLSRVARANDMISGSLRKTRSAWWLTPCSQRRPS
jgi:ribosomal protein L19E